MIQHSTLQSLVFLSEKNNDPAAKRRNRSFCARARVFVQMVFLHAEFTTQASNCVTSFGFG